MTEPPRKRMVRPPSGGADAGRGKPVRLKTAKLRTPSSQAWLERQLNDPFVADARAKGYRARAAFKLTEIDDKLRLLKPGARVLLIDDLLATGGTVEACCKLLENFSVEIVGCAFCIHLTALGGADRLKAPIFSLLEY